MARLQGIWFCIQIASVLELLPSKSKTESSVKSKSMGSSMFFSGINS